MAATTLLVALPEVPASWLDALTWIIAIAAGLWLVTSIVRFMHARAYNLTKVETTPGSGDLEPAFLSVDAQARERALEAGEAGAGEGSPAGAGAAGWAWVDRAARIGAVLAAIGHITVAVLAATLLSGGGESVFGEMSMGERIEIVLAQYWFSLMIGLVVLVIAGVRMAKNRRETA